MRADTLENVHTQNLSSVSYLEFNHDDSLLVTACDLHRNREPTVYIQPFDKASGTVGDHQSLLNLEGVSDIMAIKLSPDGQRIACITCTHTGGVWDVQSGQMTLALHSGNTRLYSEKITDIVWLGNRKIVAQCSNHDVEPHVCSWDAVSGGLVTYIPSVLDDQGLMRFCRNHVHIVLGKETVIPVLLKETVIPVLFGGRSVAQKVLDKIKRDAHEELDVGKTHILHKQGRLLSPDKRYVAVKWVKSDYVGLMVGVGMPDGRIKTERKLEGHSEGIRHLKWAPDGQYVVSCGRDDTLRLWTAGHEVCLCVLYVCMYVCMYVCCELWT